MKVLIIPSWYPYKRFPYTGKFLVDQAEALAQCGQVDISLLNWGQNAFQLTIRHPWQSLVKLYHFIRSKPSSNRISEHLEEIYLPHLTWTSYITKGNITGLAKKTTRLVKPDLIHAHVTFPAAYLACRIAELTGIPYLITEHSGPFPFPEFVSPKGVSPLILKPMQSASRIVAVSSYLKHEIKVKTNLESVIIPNVVNTDVYKASDSARKPGRFRMFTLSRLSSEKGAWDLIQALKLISDKGLDFQLLWGGEGKLKKQLKSLIENYGLQDKVILLGGLAPNETLTYYQDCDCFVLASRLETFSVVLIEALSFGKPVIATNCGGPRDIVNDLCGILVPKQNPVLMAKAIMTMSLKYPEYSPSAIRKHCVENYGFESVSRKLLALYREILDL